MNWPHDTEGGQLWIGTKGMLLASTYAQNPRLLDPALDAQLRANPLPRKYERTGGVYQEWIGACKTGTQAGSAFGTYAAPMTEMILLGCLASRMGEVLELNPNTGAITNVTPPSEWVMPTFRAGWSL